MGKREPDLRSPTLGAPEKEGGGGLNQTNPRFFISSGILCIYPSLLSMVKFGHPRRASFAMDVNEIFLMPEVPQGQAKVQRE